MSDKTQRKHLQDAIKKRKNMQRQIDVLQQGIEKLQNENPAMCIYWFDPVPEEKPF